jgi:ABC-type uncharacterized transport system substrate-binding protein
VTLARRAVKNSLGALLAILFAGGVRAARLSVVMDGSQPRHVKLVAAVTKSLSPKNRIQVFDIRTVDVTNPLEKGRFLSRVAAADLIVPIGDAPIRLVSDELEDLQVLFVAGEGLRGDYLGRLQTAGILSYSPAETIRVAKILLPRMKTIGVLYTHGYEFLVDRMKAPCRDAGIELHSYKIGTRMEIGPAVRRSAARDDLIWIAGDPILTQDLVFAYLLQESLPLKKPLASPIPALVSKGALFCTVPDPDKLSALVSTAVERMLSSDLPFPEDQRLQGGPDNSYVLVNRGLADKWGIKILPTLRLWEGNRAAP